MSLRFKLLLALLPLAIALVLIGIAAVSTIGRLGGHSQTILSENYRSVLAAQRMKESIERMDSAALFKLAGRWNDGTPLAEQHRKIFETELQVEENNITEKGEAEAARTLRSLWTEYQKRYDAFVPLNETAEAHKYYFDTLYPRFQQVKSAADDILSLNQDAMLRKSDKVRNKSKQLINFMLVAALMAAVCGVFFSVHLTRRMLRPLSVLTLAARRIGEGDLVARARVEGGDEIAHLAGEFNRMADHIDQYRRSSLGELIKTQHSTQAAIDSLPDPVVIFNLEGNLVNVNEAGERLLGLSLSPQARNPLDAVSREIGTVFNRIQAHVLSGKGPYMPKSFDEAVRVSANGNERWFLARATPLYGEEKEIAGVTLLLQDVTRLRRFDELKNDLVSTVAHEFRTPLTSLHMAIHLCLDETVGSLNEKQADLLFAARQDCERLQSMVDDLLDLSRIQSGRIEMKRQPVGVRSLLESALNAHRAAAEAHELTISMNSTLHTDETVLADPERIQLVLSNLITNAIRHTPSGGKIELSARSGGDRVRFEVSDTGEGISPEYHPRIFDKFFRIPGSKTGGVGLGLSISREIIEAHGGEIGLEANQSNGSAFWFLLPRHI